VSAAGSQAPGLLAALSRELRALVARTAPSVVSVAHRRGQGSGVMLTPDGFILTNQHVARSARGAVRVEGADGGDWSAERVGEDARTDLAVLRVAAADLPALPLADASALGIGSLVLAVGNPLRLERSVSLGVVSAIDRSLPGGGGVLLEGLIQTDAAINPGNSGGPLIDADGAVVGINTAMIPWAQGLGFAIPAQTAHWVAALLIRDGRIERPYFGIAARGVELAPALAARLGARRAVRVIEVRPATPAARAGLRPGDLIRQADGSPVGLIDDLQRIAVLGGARRIELTVQREDREERLVVEPERDQRSAA
jgi:S1-C subfamily serine protease